MKVLQKLKLCALIFAFLSLSQVQIASEPAGRSLITPSQHYRSRVLEETVEPTTAENSQNENSSETEAEVSEEKAEEPAPIWIFHLSAQIDTRNVCWTFLILLGCTILIEGFVEWLKSALEETEHWMSIVNQVFKELMMVGLISFTFNCFKQIPAWNANVPESWDTSIEFSHNVLFFIGISFALLSLTVCFVVVQASSIWQRIEDMDIKEMEAFVLRRAEGNVFTQFCLSFTPMSSAVDYMLLKHIFIKSRKLPANFEFKTYVQLVMLSNVDLLLDVEMSSWAVMALITLGGVAGTYLREGAEEVLNLARPEPEKEWEPLEWKFCLYYIFLGISMLVVEFGVFIVVRRAVNKVVAKEGFEGSPSAERIVEMLNTVKSMALTAQGDSDTNGVVTETLKKSMHVQHQGSPESASHHRRSSSPEEKHSEKAKHGCEDEEFADLDLSYAFPFNSPYVYGKFNDAFLLLKCLYLALFFVYFASASCDDGYARGLPLLVGLLFPTVFSSFVFTPRIFKLEAILNSVAQVKPSILGKVLEQMLSQTDELKSQVSAQLRKLLGEKDQERLDKLFKELDVDGSGLLTAREFEKGLAKLHIYYSPYQFKALVKLLNPEGGDIDCKTFVDFVYPPKKQHQISVPDHLEEAFQEFEFHLAHYETQVQKMHTAEKRGERLKLYCKLLSDFLGDASLAPRVSTEGFPATAKTKRKSGESIPVLVPTIATNDDVESPITSELGRTAGQENPEDADRGMCFGSCLGRRKDESKKD